MGMRIIFTINRQKIEKLLTVKLLKSLNFKDYMVKLLCFGSFLCFYHFGRRSLLYSAEFQALNWRFIVTYSSEYQVSSLNFIEGYGSEGYGSLRLFNLFKSTCNNTHFD